MAKDNRNKTAKKKGKGGRILTITVLVFFVLVIIFGVVLAQMLKSTSQKKDTSTSDVNVYDTTPTALQNKVAYYVVGLLGENEETGVTERLTIVCHDKKKNTLNILEVPQDTYLGDSEQWAVKKAGEVWGNPAPLDWCEFEGKRIFKAEIEEHQTAGHTVTQKKGSQWYNVVSIFNEQYSLPVDGYFFLSQASFVKLVDLLGGIDVDLEAAMELGGIKYGKGVKTLDGAGALAYALQRDKGVEGDIARIVRQRKVFLALFQRLCAQSKDQLNNDTLAPLMKGSTPIRTNLSTADTVKLVLDMAKITPDKMTAQVIPGEAASSNANSYYSVHRAELAAVLNADFHPYDNAVTEGDLQVTELASGKEANPHRQVLSDIAVDQTGMAQPSTDTTTTQTQKTE
ncbi:MAG: LCP family protein [Clostridia bacterium]|nr:LCP family protein [Clostridia bacterium]